MKPEKYSRKALFFGISAILIPLLFGIIIYIIRAIGPVLGFIPPLIALILSVLAIISGIKALRSGERSWMLWVGFIPAVIICLGIVFMIIGEFIYPH